MPQLNIPQYGGHSAFVDTFHHVLDIRLLDKPNLSSRISKLILANAILITFRLDFKQFIVILKEQNIYTFSVIDAVLILELIHSIEMVETAIKNVHI